MNGNFGTFIVLRRKTGIDAEQNNKRGEDTVISTKDSKVKVLVIPTNEELAIARETHCLIKIS